MQKYKILKDVLDFAKNKLYKFDIETPNLDIAILASEAFGLSKIQLVTKEYVSFEKLNISDNQIQDFLYFIGLRCKKNSISEILGIKNFYGLDFIITKDVLTPRPETEILVENFTNYILEYLDKKTDEKVDNINKKIKIIDIGTGSGCIAVSVAKILEKKIIKKNYALEIIACDISEKALSIAKKNIEKHEVSHIIKTQKSDLLKNIIKNDKKFLENSFIITNLPYIPEEDQKIMSEEVLSGDPNLALFSGKTGTDLYKKLFENLFKQSSNFFEINSCFFEFDSGVLSVENNTGKNYQKDYYKKLLNNNNNINIDFFSDYADCERFGKILF